MDFVLVRDSDSLPLNVYRDTPRKDTQVDRVQEMT